MYRENSAKFSAIIRRMNKNCIECRGGAARAIVAELIEVSFLESALGINDRLAGYACSYPHLENSEVV